jgi:hypothetical protein
VGLVRFERGPERKNTLAIKQENNKDKETTIRKPKGPDE